MPHALHPDPAHPALRFDLTFGAPHPRAGGSWQVILHAPQGDRCEPLPASLTRSEALAAAQSRAEALGLTFTLDSF